MNPEKRQRIREAVRFFYDLQKLRIQQGNRAGSDTAQFDEEDRTFHEKRSKAMQALERAELRNIERLCKTHPIYPWLIGQKGLGPTMAGVILAEIEIERAETVSSLWKFAGLDVDSSGAAPRRKKGQKNPYNAWLRTKLVGVLADCMIRAGSDWRQHYDHRKHRRQHQLVETCMGCDGTGKAKMGENKGKKCKNCNGTGGPAPWGVSDGHRHRDAIRYMVKMFLQELWIQWRTVEGLPVTVPYKEAMLGRTHGDHGGRPRESRVSQRTWETQVE